MTHISPSSSGDDLRLADLVERIFDRIAAGDNTGVHSILAANAADATRLRPILSMLEALDTFSFNPSPNSVAGHLATSSAQVPDLGELRDVTRARRDASQDDNDGLSSNSAGLLGDYRIVREVGRGGMGVVYEADQISLRRRVALKVLPLAGLLDERVLVRFRNEAQAAAGLHHQHIVPIYGVGCDRGVHYYAMQFIEGLSLDRILTGLRSNRSVTNDADTSPLQCLSTQRSRNKSGYFRRIAELGIQAADALHFAHERGILHRDIKPGNLLLDKQGDLWITDFGLARIDGGTNLTMTGDVLGTLRYMSSEQALGNHLALDQRTDICSLGATLYELLTLRPVYDGGNREQLLRQISSDEPQLLRKLDPDIPQDLETVILKSLAKDPAERYSASAEFAADLRRFLAHEPTLARPPRFDQRIAKWARRNRTLVRSLTGSLMICSISLGAAAFAIINERKNTEIERLARKSESDSLEIRRAAMQESGYEIRTNLAAREIQAWQFEDAARHLAGCVPATSEPDLRGFEWHYLSGRAEIRDEETSRHAGSPWRVTVSPDCRYYASCGPDGVRIWDAAVGSEVKHIAEPPGGANTVAFSPDGQRVATAGDDGFVCVWSVADWSDVATLKHDHRVLGAMFTPDGRQLVSVEQDKRGDENDENLNSLHFWDTATWTHQARYPLKQGDVAAGDISDDGRRAAIGWADGEVLIWNLSTNDVERAFQHLEHDDQNSSLGSLAFAHHHPWLLTSNGEGITRIWNTADGSPQSQFRLPERVRGVYSVEFSPDDRWVAIACHDTCFLLGVRDQGIYDVVARFPRTDICRSVAFAGDKWLLVASSSGSVSRHSLRTMLPRRIAFENTRMDPRFAFLPDGRLLTATHDELSVSGPSDNSRLVPVMRSSSMILSIALSLDGKRLLVGRNKIDTSGIERGEVTQWDTTTWRPIGRALSVQRNPFVHFVCDGRLLLVTHHDPASPAEWFDYPSLLSRQSPMGDGAPIAIPHLDGLLVLETPNRLALFDLQGVRWRRSYGLISDGSAIDYSPDGKRFAIAQADGTICLCSASDGHIESSFPTHSRPRRLAFSPNGRVLVGWEDSRKLKLWETMMGRELLEFPGNLFRDISRLAFSPDGRVLAVSGATAESMEILLYDTRTPSE